MKAADRLGTGASFGNVPRGRSARGRAKAITQGDVPTYELVRLRLNEVAPTPLNPRRNFGTDEEKTRFGEELRTAQLAACVAISRESYIELWPEHSTQIGDAPFVLVNGERRYRSALHVGLEALDFVVRNDLASSREEFINHLLKENLEREDFDVIERARGVQELVRVCAEDSERGAKARAAERLGKDRSWVTNQLTLLELPAEIQAMLSSGDLPERDGRSIARHHKENPELDAVGLISYLKATKEREARARAEEKALLHAVRQPDAALAENPLLSVDNKLEPTRQLESSVSTVQAGLLSADNKLPAQVSEPSDSGTPAPAPDSRLLSVDNNSTGTKSSMGRAEKSPLLSTVVAEGPKPPWSIVIPRTATPSQVADALAAHLSPVLLASLAEVLIDRLGEAGDGGSASGPA